MKNIFKSFGAEIKKEEEEIVNLLGKSYSHIWQDLLGKKIGEGFYTKVHEVRHKPHQDGIKCLHGKKMVVKIGMTHDFPVGFVSLPRKYVGKTLEWIFGSTVRVFYTQESIIKAYEEEYQLIKKNFSPLPADSKEKDPREEIIDDLQNERTKFYKELFKILKSKKLIELLVTTFKKYKNENFLKDEELVIGHPPHLTQEEINLAVSKGKEVPITYYIFQEKVEGNIVSLGEISEKELTKRKELAEKLLTFALLLKKMYEDTKKMIDTRPEHIWKTPFEWFQKTGNLLIDKNTNNVYFIDTRWLWDSNVRFLGKNGLHLVDRLGHRSICNAIKKYTEILS